MSKTLTATANTGFWDSPGMIKFKKFWRKNALGYVFMAPFVILFVIFVVAPVITAIGLSFTDYNMLQKPHFVGFNNYKLLALDDEVFKTAISVTVRLALLTGPAGYLMSFFAAWVINQFKYKRAFALAFYAPSIMSGVAMSNIWLIAFAGDRKGYINYVLARWGFIDAPIQWNTDPNYILGVIIFIQLWMSMGNGFLVFLAGLQNMDRALYEAGAIDGVKNRFQELIYITLPCMKPQLLFGAINTITSSFAAFDICNAVAGTPSPNYCAHTIVAHLYDYAFIRFQMGYASAVAVILFLITFILGKIVFKLLSSRDE